ncbi:MAG: cytochrome c biogenesis protein CcdA [Geodermatophilaceae bacterium]|nr:cytochrome c biogenesis protein CcdA [Geodermatophilaceae bacterium]
MLGDLGQTFSATVVDGPLLVAMAVAALVGLIGFLSPCVLPLVPGYLSYVTGLAGTAVEDEADHDGTTGSGTTGSGTTLTATRARRRVVAGALLFVAGFTAVFVSFGAFFGGLGRLLLEHQTLLNRVLGAVTIVLGLAFLGALPGMQREFRVHRLPSAGLVGAPVLGVVFGLGWTPCLGPTLGAVQTLAFTQGSAGRGAILSLAYCVGLGLPFVLTALGVRGTLQASAFARRHARTVTRVGGVLLVVLGVLLVSGLWETLMIDLRAWLGSTGFGTSDL